MRQIDHPPHAPTLIESMRAIGYSLEAAVADIVDNSIAAEATTVDILYSPHAEPYIAIFDNGLGMTEVELVEAMRHGSRSPHETRLEKDLGRFGLGLKTASLSQARKLTVISKKQGVVSAARWDLDTIAKTGQWTLLLLDQQEIDGLDALSELGAARSGTVVIWQDLDRLAATDPSIERSLRDGMDRVRTHLALVFHRFMDAHAGPRKLQIRMNKRVVQPVDPFLSTHAATQKLPKQTIRVEQTSVDVQPFILPHYSKLTREEVETAGGEDGLRRRQGFYVYRSRRLIIWGTWFRIARQEELTKLARVLVDVPNSLDRLWTLDIKKSTAYPPAEVRQNLSTIIGRIAERSGRVYRFRGRTTNEGETVYIWNRIETREGVRYSVNTEHPLYRATATALYDVDPLLLTRFIRCLEVTLPLASIYVDLAGDRRVPQPEMPSKLEELSDIAGTLLDAIGADIPGREAMLQNLHLLEPFAHYPVETQEIVERLLNANK